MSTGRWRQKQRTRQALIDAARELVALGTAADGRARRRARGGISRTTAYRYFPNQRSLLVAAHPETRRASLLPRTPPTTRRSGSTSSSSGSPS